MATVKRKHAPKSYDEAVKSLAREHARLDKAIREIWSFDDPQGEAVRIVEVYQDFLLPPENGVLQAVVFGPSPDFPFALEIALVSRSDWNRIQKGTLQLPAEWQGTSGRKVKG